MNAVCVGPNPEKEIHVVWPDAKMGDLFLWGGRVPGPDAKIGRDREESQLVFCFLFVREGGGNINPRRGSERDHNHKHFIVLSG